MRLGFIGGFGHHYLRTLPKEASVVIDRPAAWAPAAPGDAGSGRIAEFGGELKCFDDPIQLLDEYKPTVVSIGAIYADNGKLVAAAMERGIDVVSDKPIAATWEQLDRIRNLASKTSRTVLTEFDFRSRREFRAARQIIRSGMLGEPILATAQKSYRFGLRPSWYGDRSKYAGTMLWVASHGIDAIWFATGKRFSRVIARGGNLSQPKYGAMEDHVTAMFELENGATGLVHADYLRPPAASSHGDDRLRIAGSKGVVEVRGGRCLFIGADSAEQDVTESVTVQPMHLELLAALRAESKDLYGTQESLAMAAVLLHARDAQDAQDWVKCS
jgi:predicted dehydrogenase